MRAGSVVGGKMAALEKLLARGRKYSVEEGKQLVRLGTAQKSSYLHKFQQAYNLTITIYK